MTESSSIRPLNRLGPLGRPPISRLPVAVIVERDGHRGRADGHAVDVEGHGRTVGDHGDLLEHAKPRAEVRAAGGLGVERAGGIPLEDELTAGIDVERRSSPMWPSTPARR